MPSSSAKCTERYLTQKQKESKQTGRQPAACVQQPTRASFACSPDTAGKVHVPQFGLDCGNIGGCLALPTSRRRPGNQASRPTLTAPPRYGERARFSAYRLNAAMKVRAPPPCSRRQSVNSPRPGEKMETATADEHRIKKKKRENQRISKA